MKPTLSTALYIMIAIYLTSCSGKPSESNAREILEEEINNNSNGDFALIDFEKVNAQENSFQGQEVYIIKYKAELEVKNDCWTYINKSGIGRYFPDFKTYSSEPEFIPSLSHFAVKCNKETKVKFSGEIVYSNTENGWVAQKGGSVF